MKPAQETGPGSDEKMAGAPVGDGLDPARILIANHQFWRYSGSEIHALQLAEHFADQGAEVVLAGVSRVPWLVREIEAKGVKFVSLRQIWRERRTGYDIVWTHHETVFFLLHVLVAIRCRLAVHGILSSSVKLERVPDVPPIGLSQNLALLANSAETRDAAETASGQVGIGVLLNIVPEPFRAHPKRTHSSQLRRVVVVSNHIPDELLAAKPLLRDRGVEVEFFGVGHRYVLIDHTSLVDFDVVVTIGKTAQYALVQGIPLFLYDKFGGPGYIDPDLFDRHEARNFSGRSDPRPMSPEEICDALIEGYGRSVTVSGALREACENRYGVGPQIGDVLARMRPQAAALYDAKARFRTAARTLARRPSVPLRLVAPRAVDVAGQWLKTLRS